MFAATMRPSTLCDVCQPRVCLFVLRLLRSFACRSHGLPTFIVFLFSIVYMYWPWCVRLAIFDFCAFRVTKSVTCTIFPDWSIGRTTRRASRASSVSAAKNEFFRVTFVCQALHCLVRVYHFSSCLRCVFHTADPHDAIQHAVSKFFSWAARSGSRIYFHSIFNYSSLEIASMLGPMFEGENQHHPWILNMYLLRNLVWPDTVSFEWRTTMTRDYDVNAKRKQQWKRFIKLNEKYSSIIFSLHVLRQWRHLEIWNFSSLCSGAHHLKLYESIFSWKSIDRVVEFIE